MKKNKVFIIAEVGVNHNGSLKRAIAMIDKLSKLGVDAVKFQMANPSLVYSDDSYKADYQKRNDNSKTILEMSKKLQISKNNHLKLKKRCQSKGVIYGCSAFDLDSLKFLDKKLKVSFFKIPSGEINSIDMLKYISKKKKKIILSTGMSTLNEIKNCLKILKSNGNKNITILHCISSYPVKKENIHLNFIDTLKNHFNHDIGFSDHSLGSKACLAAVAKGAKVIEKHVTISTSQKGPDHKASMNLKNFGQLIKDIRELEKILGMNKKKFTKEEQNIKKMARKSLVTTTFLKKGQIITKENFTFKRPGTGISPIKFSQIIGKKIKKNIKKNRVLKKIHLQ